MVMLFTMTVLPALWPRCCAWVRRPRAKRSQRRAVDATTPAIDPMTVRRPVGGVLLAALDRQRQPKCVRLVTHRGFTAAECARNLCCGRAA